VGFGPLFDQPRGRPVSPEGRNVSQKPAIVSPKPPNDGIILIDGKPAKVNWIRPAEDGFCEAGITFSDGGSTIYIVRQTPTGIIIPVRCALHGKSVKELTDMAGGPGDH
jgi:hypothetical protein